MKLSPKTAIVMTLVSVLSLLIALFGPRGETTIRFTVPKAPNAIPDAVVSVTMVSWISFGIVVAITLFAWWLLRNRRTPPLYLIAILSTVALLQVLVMLFQGALLPLTTTLQSSLALAVPLIFGSLAGVLSERSGVVNIAIESQLLAGAFVSAVVASMTDNLFAGLLGAMLAGGLFAWVLAVFSIKYAVDQIIVGVERQVVRIVGPLGARGGSRQSLGEGAGRCEASGNSAGRPKEIPTRLEGQQ